MQPQAADIGRLATEEMAAKEGWWTAMQQIVAFHDLLETDHWEKLACEG